jgi:hypothetical protein
VTLPLAVAFESPLLVAPDSEPELEFRVQLLVGALGQFNTLKFKLVLQEGRGA